MMRHVMVDLETLASSSDAAIISIGAVAFDPGTGTLGAEFKVNVDGPSSQAAGLRVDAATVEWWFHQTAEARAHLYEPRPEPLANALDLFREWCAENLVEDFSLWGNGATFDNVILHHAFDAVGKRHPWSFRRDMCFRTMAAMFPNVPRRIRFGTHHDSLDDARYQAQHLLDIFASIRAAK